MKYLLAPTLLAMLLGLRSASAQPIPAEVMPAPDEPPAAQSAPSESTQPPAPASTSAESLKNMYERAFAALGNGQFAVAIQDFDQVALQASDPELRASARELARLARHFLHSGALLARRGGPSLVAQPTVTVARPKSDDDEPTAGRAEFVVSTTLAAFYAGIALVILLDVTDFRAATLVVTAATAGGFVGSLQGSKGRRITGGMSSAYSLGIGMGLTNGLLLASPLGLADDEDLFVSSGLVGIIAGGASAMVLADKAQPTRGQMSFISTLSLLGIASTGLGMVITEPDLSGDAVLTTLTLGLDAGLITGVALSPGLDWSTSRANLVSLSAFLGAVGGFGTMALIGGTPDSDREGKIFASAVLAGMWGGFGLGIHFTRDMSPDKRFADKSDSSVAVLPTLVGDAPGLAVMGSL